MPTPAPFALWGALACLAAFALAFLCARFGLGAHADVAAFIAVNRRHLPLALEIVVRQISHLGLLPTNVLIWGVVWWRASIGAVLSLRALLTPELAAAAAMLGAWATCRAVKVFIRRTRPHAALPDARLVGLEASGSSFPSSHAALSTFTALMVVHLFALTGWSALAAYALAATVCYARIYFGAHYPSDVLAGASIGVAWVILAQAVG